jgi:hypothetical protein
MRGTQATVYVVAPACAYVKTIGYGEMSLYEHPQMVVAGGTTAPGTTHAADTQFRPTAQATPGIIGYMQVA